MRAKYACATGAKSKAQFELGYDSSDQGTPSTLVLDFWFEEILEIVNICCVKKFRSS